LAIPVALHAFFADAVALDSKEPTLDEIAKRYTKRTPGGIHLPIVRQKNPSPLQRRALASSIGLGDVFDM